MFCKELKNVRNGMKTPEFEYRIPLPPVLNMFKKIRHWFREVIVELLVIIAGLLQIDEPHFN